MPDYFVGKVAMQEVERQLRQHGGIGGYVVRESTTRKGQWTISLKIRSAPTPPARSLPSRSLSQSSSSHHPESAALAHQLGSLAGRAARDT